MSKLAKGIKKGVKKVGKFVKKNWKPILGVAAAAFTGGMSMLGGFSGVASAIGSQGLLGGIGSTMLAGAQGMLGSLGIGGGLSSGLAGKLGLAQGSTLFNSGVLGNLLGAGKAGAGAGSIAAGIPLPGGGMMPTGGLLQAGLQQPGGPMMPGGGGRGGGLLSSLAPYALQLGGAYLLNKGEEDAAKPDALWGVDFNGDGFEAHQPWGQPNYADPAVAAQRPGGRGPLINYHNTGPYGG